ncbi:MAG: hypothetical protein COV02_02790 [Candidatus Terrybacteria bacterium CG10_big_fil_rev_8_21_14_0_10_41_10]|uniref:SHS2 domain-containing protein n=1 Tax=Candidatus Terrybacteria bacterium CG10_big_fil_rev_8_21_14_0_10_41_10 TaxID=1975026 RepID=A0A2M8L9W5_9BACT|nr:MAG: hypothetical protein COV02_02790 [Candidatus Terrybacteria bacterium CG10_big_fil_rev_8_21_14_0_10_41_10]
MLKYKHKNMIADFFPPPKYLAMSPVCLDISDRSIKYIELRNKKDNITVERFGAYSVPQGLVENGEIKDKEKMVDLLKSIKLKLGSVYVIASLPEEKAFLSRIKLPKMEIDEMRNSIELQLDEHVPLSAKEAVFDFEVVNYSREDGHADVNLVAFPKYFVNGYRDLFTEAGFVPIVFEMEAQAFARAIVPRTNDSAIMVIDFGRTRTTFAIVSVGKVHFTTTIKASGEDVKKAIMKNLQVDQFEADGLKREEGILNEKADQKVFVSAMPTIEAIKDEALKQIYYWDSKNEEGEASEIKKVLLCGGEASLKGLAEYLGRSIGIKTEIGNPWVNVSSFDKYIPSIEKNVSLLYSTAIGLALRQFR